MYETNHLCCRVNHIHLLENGSTIIGDVDLTIAGLNHLVHALGTKRGAHRIGDSLGGNKVARPDVLLLGAVTSKLGAPATVRVLSSAGELRLSHARKQ